MLELNVRPLGTFAAVFYVVSCFLYSSGRDTRAIVLGVSLIVFAAVILLFGKIRYKTVAAMAAAGVFAASLFSVFNMDVRLARISEFAGREIGVTAVVRSVEYTSSYGGSYIIETDRQTPEIGTVKIILSTDNGELDAGDVIRTDVFLSSVMDSEMYEEYVLANGAVIFGESAGELEVIGRDDGFMTKLAELRMNLASRIKSEMSDVGGGFAAALILGEKSDLPSSVVRDFRTLGISHVIALSGTHLTSLAAMVLYLIPCGRRLRLFIMVPIVLFYVILTGFPASVVRAGIMFAALLAAFALNKKYDVFTSLSVSALLICVFNMYAPFDVGLQLSFASVAGLIISDFVNKRIPDPCGKVLCAVKRAVLAAFLVPVILLPVMWLRFGEMSFAAPLANVFLAPVLSLLIPMLGMLLLVSAVPPMFSAIAYVSDALIGFMLRVTGSFASFADPILGLRGTITAVMLVLFTSALLMAVISSDNIRRKATVVSAFLLCFAVVFAQIHEIRSREGMNVYCSSVGTDDVVYIVSEGQNILVDIGRYSSAIGYGAEMGENLFGGRIDAFVFTHLRHSHRISLYRICENYYVDEVWLPMPCDEESRSVYESIKNEAKTLGVKVSSYLAGESLAFGKCIFYAPVSEVCSYSDHSAISFRLEYGEYGFLYTSPGFCEYETGVEDVCFVGSHGPKPRGVMPDVDAKVVVSSAFAGMADSISDKVIISDKTVVKYRRGSSPVIMIQ